VDFDSDLKFNKNDPIYQNYVSQIKEVEDEMSQRLLGISGRSKVGTDRNAIRKMQLRKYETIKKMVMYVHDPSEREWGRYCPYGCHCMVNGPTDILAGHGQPIDNVDHACKRHQDCIQCAINDFGGDVCPWWKPYKMTAMVDTQTNERHLICQDRQGYCKRALCECDAQLARDLYQERKNYDRDHHHRYGSFSTNQCKDRDTK
jgi:hypothetical protein